MPRKRLDWKLKTETLRLGDRTFIVGVLNVTPDSVTDAGYHMDPDRAFLRAMELSDQGADMVEIGAESLRPGSERVSEAEELRRLVPVLKRLRGKLPIPICVETYKPAVAEKALSLGAIAIKDPTALTLEPDLAKVASQFDAGLILQHMRGTPEQWAKMSPMKDAPLVTASELNAAVSRALRSGVMRQRIVVDPGLGMGKRKEQNLEILSELHRLVTGDQLVQVSPTGKPFATQPTVEPSDGLAAAAATIAILGGAHLLRVHDVAAIRPAILLADAILREDQQ